MTHNQTKKPFRLLLILVFTFLTHSQLFATWSIIAVDRKTGEIGIVGASCTFDVSGIASIVPRKGAIVVQAGSDYFARMKGAELMNQGSSLEEILTAMKDERFNPERQQYGVILINTDASPLVYSGAEIKDWNGEEVGNDFAVMGNILPGQQVVLDAYKAFDENRDRPLAERLMLALKAGEEAGGDKRCGSQSARSAFIMVYNPKDDAIFKMAIQGIEKGGKPAVTLLNQQFARWKNQKTTQKQEGTDKTFKSFNGKRISKSEMDTFIDEQMRLLEIPGLSIAFVNGDKMVYDNYKGVTNIDTQEKVNEKTLFDAASMSKTVFSVFVLKLVDQGLIDLDTPLYKYMEYPDIAYDERYKKITTRMVLSHTSGFPNLRYLNDKGEYNPNNKLTISFEPGTQFQYSGEGYQYLSKVIAHLKGIQENELQDLMETEIFEPLEMDESSFVWNDYLEAHRAKGHFRGKRNDGWSINANNPNFNPAASLQSNVSAFSNFLVAIMNNTLLSDKSYQELTKIQSTSSATEKSKSRNYGLGIVIEPSAGGTNYMHGGDNLSSTAHYMFNRDQKVGYVFFTNSEMKEKFNENLLDFLLEKD